MTPTIEWLFAYFLALWIIDTAISFNEFMNQGIKIMPNDGNPKCWHCGKDGATVKGIAHDCSYVRHTDGSLEIREVSQVVAYFCSQEHADMHKPRKVN